MPAELTAKQKLEIRQQYESAQLERKQQLDSFRADIPQRVKGSELSKAFKLLGQLDVYLQLCELGEMTEDNVLYSQSLVLRDINIERVTALLAARNAAIAAAKAKEDESK